jgi:hypothetical protein
MKHLVALFLFVAASSTCIADDNLVAPIEAYQLAKSHGCNVVSDYFEDRPAAENPPYALIAGDFGKLQIAVWCTAARETAEAQLSYALLLRIDDPANPLSPCPREIRGVTGIGGLSFVDVVEKAQSFYFFDNRAKVPMKGTLHTTGVLSSYDGLETYYICVDGRWVFRSLD